MLLCCSSLNLPPLVVLPLVYLFKFLIFFPLLFYLNVHIEFMMNTEWLQQHPKQIVDLHNYVFSYTLLPERQWKTGQQHSITTGYTIAHENNKLFVYCGSVIISRCVYVIIMLPIRIVDQREMTTDIVTTVRPIFGFSSDNSVRGQVIAIAHYSQ